MLTKRNFFSIILSSFEQKNPLSLFKMGFFGTAHGWGEVKKVPLSNIYITYAVMIKLGTVIPYQRKIQKNIWITWQTPWILLTSAFFHQKSASFAISRNKVQVLFWYIISNPFNFFWIFRDYISKYGYSFDDVSKNGCTRPS